MAAGDISDALLVRVRGILDEPTAGFWTDAVLFSYMTHAQNMIIDQRSLKYIQAYSQNKFIDDPILSPVLTTASIAWDTGANSITLPAGCRYVFYAELFKSSDLTVSPVPITRVGYDELQWRKGNAYIGHSFDNGTGKGQVFYYIGDKLYTSFTTGSHSTYHDKITIVYIKNPSDITTSVDPTLNADCYDAIIEYTCYLALIQDKKHQEASVHLQNFFRWVLN